MSCVIPVFNEEARVGGMLTAVVGHPLVAEVIVVDDGSTDATAAVVRAHAGARLVRLGSNQGKTRALQEGIACSAGATILLLDGDLVGLTARHVTALLGPVLDGHADIAISLRGNAPWPWRLIGLDYISGERVLPRNLIEPDFGTLQGLPRFGFEVWLNRRCIAGRCRLAVVPWPAVVSPFKGAKLGWRRGLMADLRMMADIFRTVSPLAAAAQVLAMRRLRVAPTARRDDGAPAPVDSGRP